MGKRKDLSEFEKGQIVMARGLGQSISKTAALVGCSRSAVVSIYQKCSKEGTVVNRRQGHGRPRLIDARGERRLAHVVRFNRRATVAQIAQEVNAGSDRKVSEYTVHHSLLCLGLHRCRPVRVPMLTPVHRRKSQQRTREHQNWTTEQWKKVAWYIHLYISLHNTYFGFLLHPDAQMLWTHDKVENGEVYQRRRAPNTGHTEEQEVSTKPQEQTSQSGSSWRRIVLLILAITIHNIPALSIWVNLSLRVNGLGYSTDQLSFDEELIVSVLECVPLDSAPPMTW
ncbi:Zinc transporter ZIP11 [Anabarilius grahami]|uniref:Zinc transporter ZIP11 n=1 Tax=Anabarilius grahami TaxID=495550 RepID=A0A3N0XTW4_ANAGA|nr:Zinc transporter ZIP11 [Anabarilius grahami]